MGYGEEYRQLVLESFNIEQNVYHDLANKICEALGITV